MKEKFNEKTMEQCLTVKYYPHISIMYPTKEGRRNSRKEEEIMGDKTGELQQNFKDGHKGIAEGL